MFNVSISWNMCHSRVSGFDRNPEWKLFQLVYESRYSWMRNLPHSRASLRDDKVDLYNRQYIIVISQLDDRLELGGRSHSSVSLPTTGASFSDVAGKSIRHFLAILLTGSVLFVSFLIKVLQRCIEINFSKSLVLFRSRNVQRRNDCDCVFVGRSSC